MHASLFLLMPALAACESQRGQKPSETTEPPESGSPDSSVSEAGTPDAGLEETGVKADAEADSTRDAGRSVDVADSEELGRDADAGEELDCISQEEIWEWEEVEYNPQGAPGRTCFDIPQEVASQGPIVFCPTIYRSTSICGRNLEGMLTLMGTTVREPNGESRTTFADPAPDEEARPVISAIFFFENAHVTVQNIAFQYGYDAIAHWGGGSLAVDGVKTSNTAIYYQSLSMEDHDDIWRNERLTDADPNRSVTIRNSNLGSIKDERDLALAIENVYGDVTIANNVIDGGAYAVRIRSSGAFGTPRVVANDNQIQGDLRLECYECELDVRSNNIVPRNGPGIFLFGGPAFGSVRDNTIDATRSDFARPTGIGVREVPQQPGRPLFIDSNRITIPNGWGITVEDSAGITIAENSLMKVPVEGREEAWTGVLIKKTERHRIEPEDVSILNNIMSYDPNPRIVRYEPEGLDPYEVEIQDGAIHLYGEFSEGAVFYSENICFDVTAEGEEGIECRIIEE